MFEHTRRFSFTPIARCLSLVAYLLCAISTVNAYADSSASVKTADKKAVVLEVIDSFAEMHTGPAKGYPVFYVVEQGEKIQVLTRRPDWYEVQTQRGKVGWVSAASIARTLQDTGEPADLPSVGFGDYLANRWRVGMAAGQFTGGELKGADTFNASLGYRPLTWLGAELEAGKFFGSDVRGTMFGVNLVLEPFSDWRWSPALVVGTGRLSVDAQPKLVPLSIDEEDHTQLGLRLNYYLGRNFVVRGEYRQLSISTATNNEESELWSFGFSTFF